MDIEPLTEEEFKSVVDGYNQRKKEFYSVHYFQRAYEEIVNDNMLWIDELNRENGLYRRLKEQFPGDEQLKQYCDYYIRLNTWEIEDECMKDIENARRQIEEISGLSGR